jgi:hypothetical protein
MQTEEKKYGIIAGISLIIMAIVAGFAFGYAHNSLVADSALTTLEKLIANRPLFLAELAGWGIIFITDLVVSISLYIFFRSTSRQISLITAAIRIVYTLILGLAIIQLFKVLPYLSPDNGVAGVLAANETASHITLFEKLWSIGLVIFGLHLIGLGYLSIKSKSVHWLIGYLLYLGGISYFFIHLSRQTGFLAAGTIASAERILSLPMALAEILLAFWLIYNGFRKQPSGIKI